MPNLQDTKEKDNGMHAWQWALLMASFSIALFLVGQNATDFMASVITAKQAAPFNGTALPIQKAPKWTSLTTEEYKAPYESIPSGKLVPLPKYDPSQLRTATESLGWKSESDLAIRNAKITFSTPYMGNYKLDGQEYAGSHPAVDIKLPDNTPVHAIANGIVNKVSLQTTGYGKHIVIKHENVPSLDDANAKVTLYSSYSHLSDVSVAEGDIVTKGQLIGKTGRTGTATTPHIHFQIDTSDAPWFPYWPFTYQESSAAGLSFFEAVNAGLNAEKAKAVTVNPMLYVQKYLNYAGTGGTASAAEDTPATVTPVTDTPTPVTQESTETAPAPDSTPYNPATDTTDPVSPVTDYAANADRFVFSSDGEFVPGVPETITIRAVDVNGDTVTAYAPKDYVYVKVELGGADMPQYLKPEEFSGGECTFQVIPKGEVSLQMTASDGVLSGTSDLIKATMFSDISESDANRKAISFLQKHGVLRGYPDGTFKPGNVVSRVEALKFILEGANSRLITDAALPFSDTKAAEWYSDYVATGYSKNIVAGYGDLTFKPENTVNRAEFLKMLILAMDVKINPIVTRDLYEDVPMDAWYAPYVRYAKEKNIMQADGGYFRPEEGMTRGEVAETIYRIILLKISGAETYSDGMSVASAKIDKYFS